MKQGWKFAGGLFLMAVVAGVLRRWGLNSGGWRWIWGGLIWGQWGFWVAAVLGYWWGWEKSWWAVGEAIAQIGVGVVLVGLNGHWYANWSYETVGIARFLAEKLMYLGVVQLLVAMGPFYLKRRPTGIKLIILLVLGAWVAWCQTGVEKLGFLPKSYGLILGREDKYIEAMAKLPLECPIIHPPYGANDPPEPRWNGIRIQPILRYFLYPRVLVNPVVFDKAEMRAQLRKYSCFYFPDLTDLGAQWPKIEVKKQMVAFDRNFEEPIGFVKLEKVETNIYRVELKL